MRCQRCGGVLVRETFDDLNIKIDCLSTATRCINCGCVEDPVVRANRFSRSVRTRMIPRRRVIVRQGDVLFSKSYPQEQASTR
jgi:hypothetical protein